MKLLLLHPRMIVLYIAHTFIWQPVFFVPPHRKWLIELNRMPWIAHATKIWTVFDASIIANFLRLFDNFLHHRLRLLHPTHFRRRVSDRSVALAASCSSVWTLVDLLDDRQAIENKWIFKKKTDADGNVTSTKLDLLRKVFDKFTELTTMRLSHS